MPTCPIFAGLVTYFIFIMDTSKIHYKKDLNYLDPFCGGFWRCLSYFHVYLDPFRVYYVAPALVALATHLHLKINFKTVTVVTGRVMVCFY